jgi:hypothetical protein
MRPWLLTSALLLLVCLIARAQPASVSGVIVEAFSGMPVAHARVRLVSTIASSLVFEQWSDDLGRFSIPNVESGTYNAWGEIAGYHRVRALTDGHFEPSIVVDSEKSVNGLKISVAKDAVVIARVVDERGNPMTGVWLQASPVLEDNPKVERGSYGLSGADMLGECRFVMTPGKYTIRAATPWSSSYEDLPKGKVFGGPVYDPAAVDVEADSEVEVRIDIPIRRHPRTGLSISGKVSPAPVSGEAVTVHVQFGVDRNAELSARVLAAQARDGSFKVTDLQPGFYRVFAVYSGEAKTTRSQVVEVTLDKTSVEQVELSPIPRFSVKGTVQWAGESWLIDGPVSLVPVSKTMDRARDCCTNTFNPFNPDFHRFEITDVVPDAYRVILPTERGGGLYVRQILLGDAELKDGLLDLRNGPPKNEIKVILDDKSGQISVSVLDQNGHSTDHGTVVLVPDGRSDAQVMYANSMGAGGYGFQGLPPGKYRVIHTYNYPLDEEWLRQKRETGDLVEVHEGEHKKFTLRLPPL